MSDEDATRKLLSWNLGFSRLNYMNFNTTAMSCSLNYVQCSYKVRIIPQNKAIVVSRLVCSVKSAVSAVTLAA